MLISARNFKKSIHSTHAKSLIKLKLQESKGLKWKAEITALVRRSMQIAYLL